MAAGGIPEGTSTATGLLGHGLADFSSSEYGVDYLGFQAGERVTLFVCRDEDQGWAYGERARDGARGWFPITYWRRSEEAAVPAQKVVILNPAASAAAATAGSAAVVVVEAVPTQPSVLPSAGCAASMAQPEDRNASGAMYDRSMMLQVGFALAQSGSVEEDSLGITTQDAEPSGSDTRPGKPEESLLKLVEAAGGQVRVRNLAAAGLALGIVSGGHSKVCHDIMKIVRSRQDLFHPMPESVTDVTKLSVTLRANLS